MTASCRKTAVAALLAALTAGFAPHRASADMHHRRHGNTAAATSANWAPARTSPVKRGEFQVDIVVIAFPDCEYPPDVQEVKRSITSISGGNVANAELSGDSGRGGQYTVTDYYKEYSQGITWPVFAVYPAVYMAPKPLGYYCRWDYFRNPMGYKSDGGARARKLREDALKFAKSKGGIPKGGSFTCWVYCRKLNWCGPDGGAEKAARPFYRKPSKEEAERGVPDKIRDYNPPIRWADPLWPNSVIQVHYPGGGNVMVHELGHSLGAPDFYHATEEHDGVGGTPALAWVYGPTGPAYCRWKYQAFVPREAYPVLTKSGTYRLGPRSGKFPFPSAKSAGTRRAAPPPLVKKNAQSAAAPADGPLPLGFFVPTTHPNYLLCLEYCHDEKRPVGTPGADGLLVHAINVTMSSPSHGPPDLCYIYRRNDASSCKGFGKGSPYLCAGDAFTTNSNPAAYLPNRLPAGVEITNIRQEADGSCLFDLKIDPPKLAKKDLDFSLLPQTRLTAVDQALPTSFRAELDVVYRGEPLKSEYGFCIGTRKDPDVRTGRLFPLHHRDRYEARITDLTPGAVYYIRAYAKNENGVRYSDNQKMITMPQAYHFTERETPNLFSPADRLLNTWYVKQHHFGASGGIYKNANAIITLMALANYYRAVPGETPKAARRLAAPPPRPGKNNRKDSAAIDMEYVHSNPSESRPRKRMGETDKLISRMTALAHQSGLSMPDFNVAPPPAPGKKTSLRPRPLISRQSAKEKQFGRYAQWIEKCAAALKIKKPEEVFVPCESPEDFAKHADRIKEWVMRSQPVLLVRESGYIGQETGNRHPLDAVIIDGFSGDRFHAVFPLGADRSIGKRKTSHLAPEDLFDSVTGGLLMFYRPGNPPARPPKISWPPPPPPPARTR